LAKLGPKVTEHRLLNVCLPADRFSYRLLSLSPGMRPILLGFRRSLGLHDRDGAKERINLLKVIYTPDRRTKCCRCQIYVGEAVYSARRCSKALIPRIIVVKRISNVLTAAIVGSTSNDKLFQILTLSV
jgi:hypothetical protein